MPYQSSVPNPAAFAGISVDSIQGAAFTRYDLPPFLETALYPTYSNRRCFTDTLKFLGMTTGVDSEQVGHYEMSRPYANAKFSTVTGGATSGATMTVRCHPDTVKLNNATIGGVAQYVTFAVKGSEISLPNGNMVTVLSVTKAGANIDLVLAPKKGTAQLDSMIAINTNYAIVSSASPKASGLPEGLHREVRKYSNNLQIIKSASRTNGSEMTTRIYNTTIGGKAGSIKEVILDDLMMEEYDRKRAHALLVGQINTNTAINLDTINYESYNADSPYTGTEGFLTFVETGANQLPLTFATLDIKDFDKIGKILEQQRTSTQNYMMFGSYDMNTALENVLLDRFDSNAMAYIKERANFAGAKAMLADKFQFNDESDYIAQVGFKGVRKGAFNYLFNMVHEFNDLLGLGVYSKYAQYGIFAPIGMQVDASDKTKQMPLLGYQYKKLGDRSRESMFGKYSGIGAHGVSEAPVNGFDISTSGIVCEIGGHYYQEQQYVLVTGV
jgi:hypothetical protein